MKLCKKCNKKLNSFRKAKIYYCTKCKRNNIYPIEEKKQ